MTSLSRLLREHYGPEVHTGTKTPQVVHAGGRGARAIRRVLREHYPGGEDHDQSLHGAWADGMGGHRDGGPNQLHMKDPENGQGGGGPGRGESGTVSAVRDARAAGLAFFRREAERIGLEYDDQFGFEDEDDLVVGILAARTGLDPDFIRRQRTEWEYTGFEFGDREQWDLHVAISQAFGIRPHEEQSDVYQDTAGIWDSPVSEDHIRLARGIYELTQEALAEAGLDSLTLFRGTGGGAPEPGETRPVELYVASSWTVDPTVTWQYGKTMMAEVPRERIFSIPLTGFGFLPQLEVVVLGDREGQPPLTATGVSANDVKRAVGRADLEPEPVKAPTVANRFPIDWAESWSSKSKPVQGDTLGPFKVLGSRDSGDRGDAIVTLAGPSGKSFDIPLFRLRTKFFIGADSRYELDRQQEQEGLVTENTARRIARLLREHYAGTEHDHDQTSHGSWADGRGGRRDGGPAGKAGSAGKAGKAKRLPGGGLRPGTQGLRPGDEGYIDIEGRSLSELAPLINAAWADLAGRDLIGLPTRVRTRDGATFESHSMAEIQEIAREYRERTGIGEEGPRTYAKVDKERAKRIAQAYEEMEHAPKDPRVRASYEAMARETLDQYQALLDAGFVVEFMPEGRDPYAESPRKAMADVLLNRHLYIFPTDEGFGSSDFDSSDSPLLDDSGYEISGRKAVVNDIFRAVHDLFGHFREGVGFRASGEENAWRAHSAMYSDEARQAMTAETRGQNSWVNYGPHAEHNATASGADTIYADQKAGLLPEWVMNDGRRDDSLTESARRAAAFARRVQEAGSGKGKPCGKHWIAAGRQCKAGSGPAPQAMPDSVSRAQDAGQAAKPAPAKAGPGPVEHFLSMGAKAFESVIQDPAQVAKAKRAFAGEPPTDEAKRRTWESRRGLVDAAYRQMISDGRAGRAPTRDSENKVLEAVRRVLEHYGPDAHPAGSGQESHGNWADGRGGKRDGGPNRMHSKDPEDGQGGGGGKASPSKRKKADPGTEAGPRGEQLGIPGDVEGFKAHNWRANRKPVPGDRIGPLDVVDVKDGAFGTKVVLRAASGEELKIEVLQSGGSVTIANGDMNKVTRLAGSSARFVPARGDGRLGGGTESWHALRNFVAQSLPEPGQDIGMFRIEGIGDNRADGVEGTVRGPSGKLGMVRFVRDSGGAWTIDPSISEFEDFEREEFEELSGVALRAGAPGRVKEALRRVLEHYAGSEHDHDQMDHGSWASGSRMQRSPSAFGTGTNGGPNVLHMRDPESGQGGGGPASRALHDPAAFDDSIERGAGLRRWVDAAEDHTRDHSGGTFRFDGTGKPVTPRDGFMVAMNGKGTVIERALQMSEPDLEREIVRFLRKHRDLLARDDIWLGTWLDNQGRLWLDVSQRHDDALSAARLANSTGELAIWDVAGQQEIPTQGPEFERWLANATRQGIRPEDEDPHLEENLMNPYYHSAPPAPGGDQPPVSTSPFAKSPGGQAMGQKKHIAAGGDIDEKRLAQLILAMIQKQASGKGDMPDEEIEAGHPGGLGGGLEDLAGGPGGPGGPPPMAPAPYPGSSYYNPDAFNGAPPPYNPPAGVGSGMTPEGSRVGASMTGHQGLLPGMMIIDRGGQHDQKVHGAPPPFSPAAFADMPGASMMEPTPGGRNMTGQATGPAAVRHPFNNPGSHPGEATPIRQPGSAGSATLPGGTANQSQASMKPGVAPGAAISRPRQSIAPNPGQDTGMGGGNAQVTPAQPAQYQAPQQPTPQPTGKAIGGRRGGQVDGRTAPQASRQGGRSFYDWARGQTTGYRPSPFDPGAFNAAEPCYGCQYAASTGGGGIGGPGGGLGGPGGVSPMEKRGGIRGAPPPMGTPNSMPVPSSDTGSGSSMWSGHMVAPMPGGSIGGPGGGLGGPGGVTPMEKRGGIRGAPPPMGGVAPARWADLEYFGGPGGVSPMERRGQMQGAPPPMGTPGSMPVPPAGQGMA